MKLKHFLQELFQKIGLKRQTTATIIEEPLVTRPLAASAVDDTTMGGEILADEQIDLDPRLKFERSHMVGARRHQLAHQQERCG